jgi:hypothetical protein
LLAKSGSNRSANGFNGNSNSNSRNSSDKHLLGLDKQPSKRGFTAATVAPSVAAGTGSSAAATLSEPPVHVSVCEHIITCAARVLMAVYTLLMIDATSCCT